MRPPHFWARRGPVALALAPAGWLYGQSVARRMRRKPEYWPAIPVVCIGNYTAGGEGKTPAAIAIGQIAIELGLKPGFLTRGYGGAEPGPLLVGGQDDPRRVGDEPRLLAEIGPTVVSADRPRGARILEEAGVDLIIMDDGFQNPSLGKDLTLVVTDAAVGLGNRMAMPAGPLRAALPGQLALTDAIVIVGEGAAPKGLIRLAAKAGKQIMQARLAPITPDAWRGGNFLAFAGIGRPEKFFAALEEAGAHFAGRTSFPDHHFYTEAEAEALLAHANAGAIRLVTTEKDHARLAGAEGRAGELRERSEIFAVELQFESADAVRRLIAATVEAVRTGRSKRRSAAGL